MIGPRVLETETVQKQRRTFTGGMRLTRTYFRRVL